MFRNLLLIVVALLTVSPAFAQAPSAVDREIIKLEHDWSTAWQKKDAAFLQKLFADEYLFTDPEGVTFSKTQDIANTTAATTKVESFLFSDLKVHVYGDTAVVTGLNTIKATVVGKASNGAYRFTDVFVKRDGRWQVVTSQSTLVVPKKK
ncbi:MAG: nuclear transport factor 2 family protein [Acidobacteria bacterium]|nr:nuclear transport factor 2 family protein [Acidobacteriota bacterium]